MTAKEYLEAIQLRDEQINQKRRELEDLQRRRTVISAVDYSKEKLSGSRSEEAPFERLSDKIIDLIAEINREIDVFSAERHIIINRIQGLRDCKHVMILSRRYVEYKKLADIADEMGYTYQYIVELHIRALKDFQNTYKNQLQF
ncbi:MAG: hypothetical protein K2N38_14320 [Oscillospiraceae bacterium]|nr:hypothetical protein [Oscillospiraceae bacterium]